VLHTEKAAQVAKDLVISDKTLGNWVRAERQGDARAAEPGALNEAERDELRRLRREVHELRTEREILRMTGAPGRPRATPAATSTCRG